MTPLSTFFRKVIKMTTKKSTKTVEDLDKCHLDDHTNEKKGYFKMAKSRHNVKQNTRSDILQAKIQRVPARSSYHTPFSNPHIEFYLAMTIKSVVIVIIPKDDITIQVRPAASNRLAVLVP